MQRFIYWTVINIYPEDIYPEASFPTYLCYKYVISFFQLIFFIFPLPMKKGNKSCGMPKFETIFARGEIGRRFFNANFERKKSKSEKNLKSVTF